MKQQNNKKSERQQKNEKQSSAEIKLELREYIDISLDKLHKDQEENFDKQVEEYKNQLASRIKKYAGLVIFILSFMGFAGILAAYRQAVVIVSDKISKRLDKEFSSEGIRILIEEKAKEFTEKKAQRYILEKVNEKITPFVDEIENRMQETSEKIEELDKFLELSRLEIGARYGSLGDYKRLLKIASEKSYFQEMAQIRITIILKDVSIYKQPPSLYQGLIYTKQDGTEIPADSLTTKQLFESLEDPSLADIKRHTLMAHIVRKPKKEILTEALRILTSSNSLPAVTATCGILIEILGKKASFMDFELWTKICKEELSKEKSKD